MGAVCNALRKALKRIRFSECGCAGDIPSSVRGGGIFGTRFRYSGRVQREILEDPGPLRASDSVISRTPLTRSLQRNKTRSLPHTPLQIGYGSLPRSNHSAPPHESARLEGAMGTLGSSTSLPLSTLSSPYCPEHTLPLLETLREDSPRVEEKGPDGSGSEPVSRNLSNILEKALDERVEKEFLSTQEETLTSIPEDPEPEAEIIDDQASKIEAQLSATYSATSTTTSSASTAPTATSTNVETKQLSKDNLIANPNKPSGKLAVGNGSAIFHKQLNTKPSSTSDDADDISDDDIDGDDDKYKYDENMFDGKVEVDGNDNLREPLTIKDEIPPLAQALEKKAGPSIESNNNSAFVPVYNTTDASEGVRLSTDDKLLRDSKIDQVASISSVSSSASSYGKRSQAPQGALLSVWKVFVVCFICVLIALLFVAILAIEIDIDICRKMRRIPEVEIFQTEVYEPLKRFISNKIFSTSVSGSGRQVV
ncbi:unnamed protein product [Orchesella dallaii]|uniref:FERM adjacent domain-containing protein n=1 Tax=Orchesella dallaii TaxID=48710 RepID=A0ABP1RXF6_9HEXA